MNLKKTLEHLGLVEHVDFEIISEDIYQLIVKSREVSSEPQVFDEEGKEILETQEYTSQNPSAEQLEAAWDEVQIKESDIALLIEHYLSDKSELRDIENDSINIVDNRIHSWNFANIPQPSIKQLLAGKEISETKQSQQKINEQALKYLADTDWYMLRMMETGVEMPIEIAEARQDAREKVVR